MYERKPHDHLSHDAKKDRNKKKKRTSINRKSIRCVVFFKHSGLKFRPLTTTHQTLVFFRKKTHSREKHTKKYYNEINLMYLRHELNFNWKREEKKKNNENRQALFRRQ